MSRIGSITIFAAALPYILAGCVATHEAAADKDGIIQLTGPQVAQGDIFLAGGPIEFYWRQLLVARDFNDSGRRPSLSATLETARPWTGMTISGQVLGAKGFATYRMRIRFDPGTGRMGFWLPHQFSAARVFVNGTEMAAVGTISPDADRTIEARQNILVFFEPRGEITEFIFHIANENFHQGGMRGQLVLGTEDAVRRHVARRTVFEIATLGVVLGAAVYHLVFFLMHRRETAFLWFSLLCLSLALHIPFQAGKIHALFVTDIAWVGQAKFLAILNAASVPLGALLLRSLFSDLLPGRLVWIYVAAGAGALLAQTGSLRVAGLGNLIYLATILPIFTIHALWILYRAFQRDHASALMALGVAALGCFSGLSIFSNWRGGEGGVFAVAGYLTFVLFQSLALSRFFLGAVKAEADLSASLRESRLALTRQREELQINLHDSLGGALTDLQIYTEQQMTSAAGAAAAPLLALHDRIVETVKMFRSQLLLMEDLELTVRELLPGIQMTLLRRYADAGREIDFEVSADIVRLMEKGAEKSLPEDGALDLFFLAIELCTNDLKYGAGESFWRISLQKSDLCIVQRNGMRPGAPDGARNPAHASDRVHKLSGHLRATQEDGEFIVEIQIPLRKT